MVLQRRKSDPAFKFIELREAAARMAFEHASTCAEIRTVTFGASRKLRSKAEYPVTNARFSL
jgi:hypothetical protein